MALAPLSGLVHKRLQNEFTDVTVTDIEITCKRPLPGDVYTLRLAPAEDRSPVRVRATFTMRSM